MHREDGKYEIHRKHHADYYADPTDDGFIFLSRELYERVDDNPEKYQDAGPKKDRSVFHDRMLPREHHRSAG